MLFFHKDKKGLGVPNRCGVTNWKWWLVVGGVGFQPRSVPQATSGSHAPCLCLGSHCFSPGVPATELPGSKHAAARGVSKAGYSLLKLFKDSPALRRKFQFPQLSTQAPLWSDTWKELNEDWDDNLNCLLEKFSGWGWEGNGVPLFLRLWSLLLCLSPKGSFHSVPAPTLSISVFVMTHLPSWVPLPLVRWMVLDADLKGIEEEYFDL